MTAPVYLAPTAALDAATPGALVRLDGAEGRHAVTVRRSAIGEVVRLVDGAGRWVDGTIAAIVGGDAADVLVAHAGRDRPPAPRIVAVQAVPKGDRGELAVEVLTEIGADVIVPWAADRCVAQWRGDKANRGRQRWQDAGVAAAKQARRTWFPEVSALARLNDVVAHVMAADLAVVLSEDAADAIGDLLVPTSGAIVFVVGPEGGISPTEHAALIGAGGRSTRCGPHVLRTSTAGVAAISAVLARSERWRTWAPTTDARMTS